LKRATRSKKRPRRSVVLPGRPVEPVATAFAGDSGDRFDELAADAAALEGCVDKEILQVILLRQ
jgi:hypothetical protein